MILTVMTIVGLTSALAGVVILLRMLHKSGLRWFLTPSELSALVSRCFPVPPKGAAIQYGVTTINQVRRDAGLVSIEDLGWEIKQRRMP